MVLLSPALGDSRPRHYSSFLWARRRTLTVPLPAPSEARETLFLPQGVTALRRVRSEPLARSSAPSRRRPVVPRAGLLSDDSRLYAPRPRTPVPTSSGAPSYQRPEPQPIGRTPSLPFRPPSSPRTAGVSPKAFTMPAQSAGDSYLPHPNVPPLGL